MNSPHASLLKRIGERLSVFVEALRLVWSSSRFWLTAALALIVLQAVLPILVLFFTGQMIDAISAAIGDGGAGQNSGLSAPILISIALLGLLTFANIALNTLSQIVREIQSHHVTLHVTEQIQRKSIEVDLAYYESPAFYNQLHRVQQYAPFVPQQVVDALIQTLRDGLLLLSLLGLLTAVSPAVPLLLIGLALPTMLIRMRFSKRLFDLEERSAETERRSAYFNALLSHGQYAKEARLYDFGEHFRRRFSNERQQLFKERLKLSISRSRSELASQFLNTAGVFLALALIASDALRGAVTIGGLVIAFQAFQRGQAAVNAALAGAASLYDHQLFLRHFREFMQIVPQIRQPPSPRRLPKRLQSGIRFEEVSFRYRPDAPLVLDQVSLTLQPGEIAALVGSNGAGKTTLVKLLCRLYDPTDGRITIDGIDLRELDLKQLRRMITTIFQDFNQYQLSASENIWIGQIDEPLDMARVQEAARLSGADEVIKKLKMGYDTQLGQMFAQAHQLSFGQWQKIALARAFSGQSEVIILDEPTSSLDVIAEHEFIQRFKAAAAGKTGLIISHRLSTIQMVSKIFVLDGGRLVETGTHADLMALNGLYAHIFSTQAQYYR
jgi:ATP-binding cassette subfamily B protein